MSYAMLDGSSGVASGESDLWCTYAAVRVLRWLDRLETVLPAGTGGRGDVERFLRSRRNSDGGFAWSAGMSSDAWATYYCTQALADLGVPHGGERSPAGWIDRCANDDGGFGMTPGQASDVWATYYAVRVLVEICGEHPPAGLRDWLAGLQAADGGLCWSPAHAKDGESDVRACYYGVLAWATSAEGGDAEPPWDRDRLVDWLIARQSETGGFRFRAGDDTDCVWATFRATGALARLGVAADRERCVGFVRGQRVAGESFTRWPGYPVQDVWAAFCAVGSLITLGDDVSDIADQVARVVLGFRIDGGGFTYRRPGLASDVLSTSATLLAGGVSQPQAARMRDWLSSCVLPNENGIMYMPGRGSEVRCTLWALCAGALAGAPEALGTVAGWLSTAIHNPDGGFGYWEGRASDMVSTSAATEILARTGGNDGDRAARIAAFVATCRVTDSEHGGEYANVPGGAPTLRSTLQAARTLRRTAPTGDPAGLAAGAARWALAAHRVPGGGFAAAGRRLPDLLSTYEAVLTSDVLGIEVDVEHAVRFLASVRVDHGSYAWTPLVTVGGGPLADAVGACLQGRLGPRAAPLPPLTIS